MKRLLTHGRFLMLLLLSSAAPGLAQSVAQSLGAPTTRAWIGIPLDFSVPVRFTSPDIRPDCVQAEVSYGERRLMPQQVRTSLAGGDPVRKRVRVEADVPIDEPVVTVSVRAGCAGALTRTYTLLPEIPSEQVLASLPPRQDRAPESLAQVLRAATPEAAATATAMARAAAPRRPRGDAAGPAWAAAAAAPVRIAAAGPSLQQRTARPAGARTGRPAPVPFAGPRLRLEPVELPEDGQALLRMSSALAQPAGDPARRAGAALLWQALNAAPEERMRTAAQLQALQEDLAQVRQGAARTQAEVAVLRRQLAQPEAREASGAALQALALAVLAVAALAAAAWMRSRRAGAPLPWVASPLPARQEPVARGQEPDGAPDLPATPSPVVAPTPASPALHRPDSTARVETLAATLDEVEFLSTLGLRSDATDVLKTYLQNSAAPAPVAYVELMRLSALDGDHHALAALRRRYARAFGVQAPSLERVARPLGLEQQSSLAARLTAAWQGGNAAAVIEDALFGRPDPAEPPTVQCARELLFLHELAQRLAAGAQQGASPPDPAEHALAPWVHADDPQAAHVLVADAHADALALDLDLDAPAPAPVAAPDVPPELTLEAPDLVPVLADMQAAAREAEERDAAARRREEDEEAFSIATASERRIVRL